MDLAELRQDTTQLPQPMHFSGSTEECFPWFLRVGCHPDGAELAFGQARFASLALCRIDGRLKTALGDPFGQGMLFLGEHMDERGAAAAVAVADQLVDLGLVQGEMDHGVCIRFLDDPQGLLGSDLPSGSPFNVVLGRPAHVYAHTWTGTPQLRPRCSLLHGQFSSARVSWLRMICRISSHGRTPGMF